MNKPRQRIVLLTGFLLGILYAVVRLLPDLLPSGAGFSIALALVLLGAMGAVFSTIRSQRLLRMSILAFLALVVGIGLVTRSNIRRVVQQHQLEGLGATVVCDVDQGDGVWFRWQGVYLPLWCKTILGDAFFGRISEIDLSKRTFSVDDLCQIELNDPLQVINLGSCDVNNADIERICNHFDSFSLMLNSTQLDNEALGSFACMKSLRHAAVIDTQISQDAAQKYIRAKTSRIRSIVVGDYSNFVQAK